MPEPLTDTEAVPERIFPNIAIRRNVRNSEARGQTKINVGVLHCTEGGTLRTVLDWFDNPDAQASSNVIVGPDKGGVTAVCMPLLRESWGVAGGWNPHLWNLEILGYAKYTASDWWHHAGSLEEAARWMAYLAIVVDLPLRKAKTESFPKPKTNLSGWTEHRWMRDHDDPGPNFPFFDVLKRAIHYRDLQLEYRKAHGHLPVLA